MKVKFLLIALALSLGIIMLSTTASEKETLGSSMLMDENPPITEKDKAIAESSKPMPIPAEPHLQAKPKESLPSAMLEDIDVLKEKEVVKAPEKPEEAPPSPLPLPMPEEPKPPKKKS